MVEWSEGITVSQPRFVPVSGKKGRGLYAIVDEEDFGRVSAHAWFLTRQGYLIANMTAGGRRVHPRMHRFILGPPAGQDVDHKNGNKLDNRKGNLRAATRAQSCANRPKLGHSRWPYKGLRLRGGKWRVRINVAGVQREFGRFDTAEEAARAYDAAARAAFGEYARTNF